MHQGMRATKLSEQLARGRRKTWRDENSIPEMAPGTVKQLVMARICKLRNDEDAAKFLQRLETPFAPSLVQTPASVEARGATAPGFEAFDRWGQKAAARRSWGVRKQDLVAVAFSSSHRWHVCVLLHRTGKMKWRFASQGASGQGSWMRPLE